MANGNLQGAFLLSAVIYTDQQIIRFEIVIVT